MVAHDTGLVYIDMNDKMIKLAQRNIENYGKRARRLEERIEFTKNTLCNLSNRIKKYEKANNDGRFNKCVQELRGARFRMEMRLSTMEFLYKSLRESEVFWRSQEKYIIKEAEVW